MLAGGEHITRASSVNAATLPLLAAINRTGSPPANDNLIAAIARMERTLAMAMSQVAQIEADGNERTVDVGRKVDGLRLDIKQVFGAQNLRSANG
jgi:hypothetical protein